MSDIRKIAVLTSGGDAPGMNSAVRAVVVSAINSGIEIVGVMRGYEGLIDWETQPLGLADVRNINNQGGTILFTSRSERFLQKKYREQAAKNLRDHDVDALVAIGGDGTLRGAIAFQNEGINTICIPGTIDRDVACSEYTLGFDTAANTAMEAIDKVRDTSASHERCSIIEVMGRTAGHIALWCGISNGSEYVMIPERYDNDEEEIIEKIMSKRRKGKKHHIIVNAEGIGHSHELAKMIEERTGIETRATVIGHIQRGGNPSCRDRVYASAMGALAVDILIEGKTNRVVAYKNGKFCDYDIDEALNMTKDIDEHLYSMTRRLSR